MRRVLIIIMSMFILLLVGCQEDTINTFSDMIVKDKKSKGVIGAYTYTVTLEKDGEEVELLISPKNYRALKKGTTVTVTYDSGYYITSMVFPKIQSESSSK